MRLGEKHGIVPEIAVRKEAEITGAKGAVKQVLDIANFARLFRIS